jgi:hypothetical protein
MRRDLHQLARFADRLQVQVGQLQAHIAALIANEGRPPEPRPAKPRRGFTCGASGFACRWAWTRR